MRPRALSTLLLLPLLAGCGRSVTDTANSIGTSLQSGETFAIYGAEGRWLGPVTPVDPNCGRAATGLMTVGSSTFAFDPFESSIAIQGSIQDGHLKGEETRAAPGQAGVTTRFTGEVQRPAGGKPSISGTVVSGRCQWNVALHRG